MPAALAYRAPGFIHDAVTGDPIAHMDATLGFHVMRRLGLQLAAGPEAIALVRDMAAVLGAVDPIGPLTERAQALLAKAGA